MWHICGFHGGPMAPGTVPLMTAGSVAQLTRWHDCPLLPLTLGFLEYSGLRTTRASTWVREHLPPPPNSVLLLLLLLTDLDRGGAGFFFILILKAKVAR